MLIIAFQFMDVFPPEPTRNNFIILVEIGKNRFVSVLHMFVIVLKWQVN